MRELFAFSHIVARVETILERLERLEERIMASQADLDAAVATCSAAADAVIAALAAAGTTVDLAPQVAEVQAVTDKLKAAIAPKA